MKELFDETFKKLGYENDTIIVKSDKADFQCNDAFKLAKKYHKNPYEIAEEVTNNLKTDLFTLEPVKPGFININVTDKYINDNLNKLMIDPAYKIKKQNKKIIIDYGGPNVAKPLHVGHLRSAIIGQSISNMLRFEGNEVISDVHLGDIGTQMGQVIYGILEDYKDVPIDEIKLTLDYLNKTYPRISKLCKEDEQVKEKCAEITKDLQNGNEKYIKLWKQIMNISKKDIKKIYDYLDIKFDTWYGESDSMKYYGEMIPYLEKQGIVKEDQGAKIIDVKEKEDKAPMPPFILQKSDGAYLYSSSDLATVYQRQKDYHPDDIIYVADARQKQHFIQFFRASKKGNIYNKKFEFHGFGTVNDKDNKPFKTRTGGALKLEDLIKEVKKEFINLREENKKMDEEDIDKIVNAIIKFADLQNNLEKSYIFDIKKFSEVNGKTGPYILYTYLRINKLIEKKEGKLDKIYNEYDRSIRLKLLEVTDILNKAISERRPHYIADYLYELSVLDNNFYQNVRFTNLDEKTKENYYILLTYNNKIIKTLLNLLGIKIPQKM